MHCVEFALVDLDELVDVVQLLLDEFQLLVEVGRRCLVGVGQFGLIQDFIDGLAQLVELVAVLLVLELEGDDHLLVVLLALPLLLQQLLSCVLTLWTALHPF
jgi:hypothetical protein